MLERAADLLTELSTLRTLVREDAVAGELRLGTINTALHTMLPRVLGRLAKAHPEVTVFIQSGNSQQLFDAVRAGELDAAVCLHPDFALTKAYGWELLREEPLVVLAPVAMADRDPLELLRTQPLLRYDRSLGGGKQAERYASTDFHCAFSCCKVVVPHASRNEIAALRLALRMVGAGGYP